MAQLAICVDVDCWGALAIPRECPTAELVSSNNELVTRNFHLRLYERCKNISAMMPAKVRAWTRICVTEPYSRVVFMIKQPQSWWWWCSSHLLDRSHILQNCCEQLQSGAASPYGISETMSVLKYYRWHKKNPELEILVGENFWNPEQYIRAHLNVKIVCQCMVWIRCGQDTWKEFVSSMSHAGSPWNNRFRFGIFVCSKYSFSLTTGYLTKYERGLQGRICLRRWCELVGHQATSLDKRNINKLFSTRHFSWRYSKGKERFYQIMRVLVLSASVS